MQSPLKKIIVYDLETGGLSSDFNSITEIALVVIDLEKLVIVDEMSVMIKPRIDISLIEEEPLKEAKSLYKRLATKDEGTGIKTLMYGSEKITLKNIEPLVQGIISFKELTNSEFKSNVLNIEDLEYIGDKLNDPWISNIYFDNAYNPQALEVTKIPKKLLIEEGIEFEEAFKMVFNFIKSHQVGNSKPILAGHNIKSFDNPFTEKFFKDNKSDLWKIVNKLCIDTLEWARIKYWELPSYSLGVVANELDLTLKEAHRALPDTIANANVLIKMLKSLKGDGGSNTKYVREKFEMNY